MKAGKVLAIASLFALAAIPAAAQDTPTYKCVSRGRVVYTQVPCAGAKPLGSGAHRTTDRYRTPPQDRAQAARRARLTPEERKECSALDARLKEQGAALKQMGASATLKDEMPLVESRKKYRELRC